MHQKSGEEKAQDNSCAARGCEAQLPGKRATTRDAQDCFIQWRARKNWDYDKEKQCKKKKRNLKF